MADVTTYTTVRKTKIGCSNPVYAKHEASGNYGLASNKKALSEAVAINESLNFAEATFYSNDRQSEYAKDFKYCDITFDNKGISDEIGAEVFGNTLDTSTGKRTYKASDACPYITFGYTRTLIDNGVKYYEGVVYPMAKATPSGENASTKQDNLTMNGESLTLRVTELPADVEISTTLTIPAKTWKITEVFTTETDAVAFVATFFKATT